MIYNGHVENGKVVFDEPAALAEGTRVRIEVALEPPDSDDPSEGSTLAERLASIIGIAQGLPSDAAENLDHYLYGMPKRG